MANVLSMPFQFSASGAAAAVDQGSDEYYRQQVTTLLLTVQGERLISRDLGMPDMAFAGFAYSAFHSQVTDYLPEISALDITLVDETDATQTVTVAFDISPERT